MRNKKLSYVLIPLIIVVLILIAGVIFLKLNSTPEKVFEHSISKVFEMFETTEEQYSTMKGTMNFTVDFENDNTEVANQEIENVETETQKSNVTGTSYTDIINKIDEKAQNVDTNDVSNMVNDVYAQIYEVLEASSIGLNMEIDNENMIINENINVIYDNEKFIEATILMQDEKAYLYLPDWLNKYLEIPEEEADFAELTESYKKSATVDINGLVEAIKEELISAISSQELIQEETTLVLDGQETKVTASILTLQDDQITGFFTDFLNGLNQNEKFQLALGDYKEEITTQISETLQNKGNAEGEKLIFKIYTKGFFNEFVGISWEIMNSYTINGTGSLEDYYVEKASGIEIFKHSEEKYELIVFGEYQGERQEESLTLTIENTKESKNKGTTTIILQAGEEQFGIKCSYEKQGKQTNFEISTIIDDTNYKFTGKIIEDGKKYEGDVTASFELADIGKINAKYEFNFVFDEQVQKVDVGNSVLIDELSEEDQEEFTKNFQKSKLYETVEQITGFNIGTDQTEITHSGYTVSYNMPDGFEASSYNSNSEDMKMYLDEKSNIVNVSIHYNSVDTYMNDLDNEYLLTLGYENVKINETKKYTVNNKEYKLKTITYNNENNSYVDLHFAYELDDEYCYVVKVKSKGGKISMDTIKSFLDVEVLRDMDSLINKVVEDTSDVIEKEEDLANGKIIVHGKEYNSIDDYINSTSMQ